MKISKIPRIIPHSSSEIEPAENYNLTSYTVINFDISAIVPNSGIELRRESLFLCPRLDVEYIKCYTFLPYFSTICGISPWLTVQGISPDAAHLVNPQFIKDALIFLPISECAMLRTW